MMIILLLLYLINLLSNNQNLLLAQYNLISQPNNSKEIISTEPILSIGKYSGNNIQSSLFSGYQQTCSTVNLAFRCWGSNTQGESDLPRSIFDKQVIYASIGRNQFCVIQDNLDGQLQVETMEEMTGDIICYGNDEYGQLTIPENLSKSNVELLSAGDWHVCAKGKILVFCWGLNDHGQLEIPQDSLRDVIVVSARNYSTCIINDYLVCFGKFQQKVDDMVKSDRLPQNNPYVGLGYNHICQQVSQFNCVGDNEYGQLDHKPLDGHEILVSSVYGNHNCAVQQILSSGSAYNECWGVNDQGQSDLSQLPTRDYTVVTVGESHSCFLKGCNNFICVGTNQYKLNEIPDQIKQSVQYASAGGKFSFFIIGGIIKCYGKNQEKQLKTTNEILTQSIEVSAGYSHVCASYAFLLNYQLSCWGLKEKENHIIKPPDAINQDSQNNILIDSGYKFSCVAFSKSVSGNDDSCKIVCWGVNDHGQVDIPNGDSNRQTYGTQVTVGIGHACGRLLNSQIFCWGRNDKGQATIPTNMSFNNSQIYSGYQHTCAVSKANYGECWGHNNKGQTDIPNWLKLDMIMVSAGGDFSCGVVNDLKTVCWGGGLKQTRLPRALTSGTFWVKGLVVMFLGQDHGCATNMVGKVVCWGDDEYGQVTGVNA